MLQVHHGVKLQFTLNLLNLLGVCLKAVSYTHLTLPTSDLV